jgi:outer membrane protein assembly factor BamD (BamD/ComL family)
VAVTSESAADEALEKSRTAASARSPEAWYAEIEKLRAAGRIEEADRELERLEKAYPGWLEQYLEKRSER